MEIKIKIQDDIYQQAKNKLGDEFDKFIEEQNKNQSNVESTLLNEVMIIVNRIHTKLGSVGENQLKNISNNKNVPFLSVLNHCKKQGLTIVPFNEVPKR